ncbi:MAG: tRNA threonylcarbamoyladenosine dehydratase [Oscillospiraceae bacterium]|nr:tRNA threonylcarbamoyladenosine dehydratase [Oscillospiraceae bacterium]
MSDTFLRTIGLIGEENLQKLKNFTVALFGIGGVGSFALEALVRSGVGTIYIYDNDTVSESNINRQLIADTTTVGALKTEVAAKRAKLINPDINIIENSVFVNPNTDIPFGKFDYIIDAIDNITAKLYLIENANSKNIPIISVMGTGNKLNPSMLKISDIKKTHTCPLARVMRIELRKRNINKLDVVWSDEPPVSSGVFDDPKTSGRPSPASMCFVPSTAGILAASFVVNKIIG